MKIWSLQVLRFWAALCVVFHHGYTAVYQTTHHFGLLGVEAASFGRFGVDIFFVLSGVIITLTSRGLTAGEFLAKRARRILPLYAVFTALYLAATAATGHLNWRDVATSLTLWPAYDRFGSPLVPVGWTLCFEALFYACAALVLWRPKLIWPLLGAYAVALGLRVGPILQFLGNPLILEFLAGVGLTFLPRWRGAAWLIGPALVATWFLGVGGYPPTLNVPDFLAGTLGWERVLYLGLPAVVVVWGALQLGGRQGPLTVLGDASYALYLCHLPVVSLIVWGLCRYSNLPPDAVVLAAATPTVVLGWRIHELFEKPMLTWLRRPLGRALPA